MLKVTASNKQTLFTTMNTLNTKGNYLEQELLPLIKTGNWKKLQNMIIYHDGIISFSFKDDKWLFIKSEFKDKSFDNLIFQESIDSKIPILYKANERMFINEIKCIALACMYFSSNKLTLATIAGITLSLRNMARMLLKHNISSFADLTLEIIIEMSQLGYDFYSKNIFRGINKALALQEYLPFTMKLEKAVTHKQIHVQHKKPEQFQVIPFRIYCDLLNYGKRCIEKAFSELGYFQAAVEQYQKYIKSEQEKRIKQLRHGSVKLNQSELKSSSVKSFLKALNTEKINFIDYGKEESWQTLFQQHRVTLAMPSEPNITFLVYKNTEMVYKDFKNHLNEIVGIASWLCLLLSGMRINELFDAHPIHGAQTIELTKNTNSSNSTQMSDLETIYLLTTKKSKIISGSQTEDDVFVTTALGYKSFKVLSSVQSPIRNRLNSNELPLFVSLHKLLPTPSGSANNKSKSFGQFLSSTLRKLNKKGILNLTLNQQDIDCLYISEKTHNWEVDNLFSITSHMCRRSLAYYLIGYELCSFPALKQQFSHVSMAMTRWYARNASSFQKM
ncbi:hypothetical protein WNY63_20455 [Pseudoalteromonas neustonica]|uniref:Integrase n=1 Tax=Pseudoalteromonas neustonica TaxID=1840331 RepID=A0ABU9U7T3_9GAMM